MRGVLLLATATSVALAAPSSVFTATADQPQQEITNFNQLLQSDCLNTDRSPCKFDPTRFDYSSISPEDMGFIDDRNEKSLFGKKKPVVTSLAGKRIKKIVLLVLENRSFDHVCGSFKYSPEIDGIKGTEYNDLKLANGSSVRIYATRDARTCIIDDPGHGIGSVTEQIFGTHNIRQGAPYPDAPMSGFAQNMNNDRVFNTTELARISAVMKSFGEPEVSIPVTHFLAKEFALFDKWHASFPGSTMPNRMFIHSATSHGEVNTDGVKYIVGYPQKTLYNLLSDNGYSWINYFKEIPSLLVMNKNRKLSYLDNYKLFHTFDEDARKGRLPDVSFLDPNYGSLPWDKDIQDDGHPAGGLYKAERMLKKVYDSLRASPDWESTAFIVTFDEHGGFYDHVSPPSVNIPSPDGRIGSEGFTFDRLGVRVPTIVASPWVKKSKVDHRLFEHASIVKTISSMWNLQGAPLNARDASAASFESIFEELSEPRKDTQLVTPAPYDGDQEEGCSPWNPSPGYIQVIRVMRDVVKKFFALIN